MTVPRLLRRLWPGVFAIGTVLGCGQAMAGSESMRLVEAPDGADCATPPLRCAQEALRTVLGRDHERVELQVSASAPTRASLRTGESARVRPIRWTGLPARRMTVWLDVVSHGRVVRAVPVEIEVHAWAAAWQATADLRPAATAVNEGHLTKAWVDMTTIDVAPWRGELDGRRLRKPLLAGQVLTVAHLERVTAVTRGQRVDVKASSGELQIDAQAQALQDGQVGDLVQVRVSRSAAAVTGRVVGSGTVEVVW